MAILNKNYDDMYVVGRSPFLANYEKHNSKMDYHRNCMGSGLISTEKQKPEDIYVPRTNSCWYVNDHHLDSEFGNQSLTNDYRTNALSLSIIETYKSLKALDKLSEKINSIEYDNCDKNIDIVKPIDTDQLAKRYFPITLGRTYEVFGCISVMAIHRYCR